MAATLEQIDKLRERANVSYEEAKEAMALCNDDFLSALIYLEKLGKVRNETETKAPPPPPWATQPPWAQRQSRAEEYYTYSYPPYAYDSRARHFEEKMRHKAEKARRWAYRTERKFDEAREAEFWKEFWYCVKKFFRLSIYGICMVPIMFFATIAALFTKFRVKVEHSDGKDVPLNGMLDKIAKFADEATQPKTAKHSAPETAKCENEPAAQSPEPAVEYTEAEPAVNEEATEETNE